MNNPQQTPLEKLISDRRRIQQECTIQEQKLNADFSHIQENAGTLLLSGVSALLFPNTKTKSKGTESNQPVHTSEVPSMSLGFADYLSVAQGLLPVAWDVARPLLTAWGIQKVQAWIIKKLFKEKEISCNNLIYVRGHIFLVLIPVQIKKMTKFAVVKNSVLRIYFPCGC